MTDRPLPHVLPGDRVRLRAGTPFVRFVPFEDEQLVATSRAITIELRGVSVRHSGLFADSWNARWRSGSALLQDVELRRPADRHHLRRGVRNDYRVAWAEPSQLPAEPQGAPVCVDCARLPGGVGCWRHIQFYGPRPVEDVTCLWGSGRCEDHGSWTVQGHDLTQGVLTGFVVRICTGHLDEVLDAAVGDGRWRLCEGLGL